MRANSALVTNLHVPSLDAGIGPEVARARRDQLEAAFQALDDAVFLLEPDGEVSFANKAARGLVAALAADIRDIPPAPCLQRQTGTAQSCAECLADPSLPARRCRIAIGGTVYEIDVSSLEVRGSTAGGRMVRLRDITSAWRLETCCLHRERLSVLGEIAATVVHDLSGPLTAIALFSQMLHDGPCDESSRLVMAEAVHRNSLACKQTIRSLLEIAASSTSVPGEVDAGAVAGDVVELLRPVAAQRAVSLRLESTVEGSLVLGDEIQLRQVLINLLINAIQAVETADRREVVLEVSAGSESLVLSVTDSGSGVPPELRQRIFEAFFTTKEPGRGTGLGLSTARSSVEAHGGKLLLAHAEKGCTRFEVCLPRSDSASRARPSAGQLP